MTDTAATLRPEPEPPAGGAWGMRGALLAAVAVVVALAWAMLIDMAAGMYDGGGWQGVACASGLGALTSGGCGMAMPAMMPQTAGLLAMLSLMWIVMMVAMMLPTAIPTLLAHVDIAAAAKAKGEGAAPTAVFVAGYIVVWAGFGVVLAVAQASLGSGMAVALAPVVGGAVLLIAAAYQVSPQKDVCLTHCRSPLTFFLQHWKPGVAGSLRMGMHHGVYCVGCCWALMVLMFVGGTMNIVLMALLTLAMGVEKVTAGPWPTRVLAVLCAGAGLAMLAAAWLA